MKQNDRKPRGSVVAERRSIRRRCRRSRRSRDQRRRSKWLAAAFVLGIAMILPVRAHAGIFDVFEIFGTIQNDIGGSLSPINQIAQQIPKLYQPHRSPRRSQSGPGLCRELNQQFSRPDERDIHYALYSAVTPGPRRLRTILHSRLSARSRPCRPVSWRTMGRSRR